MSKKCSSISEMDFITQHACASIYQCIVNLYHNFTFGVWLYKVLSKSFSVFGEHLISGNFADLTPASLEWEGFIPSSRCEIPSTTPSQSTCV